MFPRWAPPAILLCCLASGCAPLRHSRPSTTDTGEVSTGNEASAIRLPPVAPAPLVTTAEHAISDPIAPTGSYHWRDRPFSGGYQVGWLIGGPFEKGNSDVPNGLLLAKRYGWDFADHWGLETRLADAGLSESNRFNPTMLQTERVLFWDMSLLYYPLGDTRLRPYATFGAGLADFKFVNEDQHSVHKVLADLPFGIGVKYPVKDWLVLRAELLDSLSIGGSGLATMDNVSLTGGAEIRFGDLRKHFLPWLR